MNNYYSVQQKFFENTLPDELLKEYGSPLYVYNEQILRGKCRKIKKLVEYPHFKVTYSVKANSNVELLRIVRQEGLHADAMSPGEIYVLLKAGFEPENIFYISNNVSEEEMLYAIKKGIMTSVDSLSQLEQFGRINPGGNVAVRLNTGVGAGHHEKVITGGENTKFGISLELIPEIKKILSKYNLKINGVNHHIGSLFMEGSTYIEGIKAILEAAENFEGFDFIDFGGGFGIPYHKQQGESELDIKLLGISMEKIIDNWIKKYGREIMFRIEPGRYISAECGILLGTVHAVKQNYNIMYIGTDIGFNVINRPVMYNSYHDIEIYRNGNIFTSNKTIKYTVVGNICESGDIIARDRMLPEIKEGDLIGIMDAGAYGYSMSSNYNNRLRPAEVLIKEDGNVVLIRRRDTLEDIMRNFPD